MKTDDGPREKTPLTASFACGLNCGLKIGLKTALKIGLKSCNPVTRSHSRSAAQELIWLPFAPLTPNRQNLPMRPRTAPDILAWSDEDVTE